jgi:hypothetical protein
MAVALAAIDDVGTADLCAAGPINFRPESCFHVEGTSSGFASFESAHKIIIPHLFSNQL